MCSSLPRLWFYPMKWSRMSHRYQCVDVVPKKETIFWWNRMRIKLGIVSSDAYLNLDVVYRGLVQVWKTICLVTVRFWEEPIVLIFIRLSFRACHQRYTRLFLHWLRLIWWLTETGTPSWKVTCHDFGIGQWLLISPRKGPSLGIKIRGRANKSSR